MAVNRSMPITIGASIMWNRHVGRSAPSVAARITIIACRSGVSGVLIVRFSKTIERWIARSRQRRALGKLVERDDYLLKDIGVSPEEARREATKPFWQ